MVIDFEHHYIPAELGQRMGMDPARKEGVRTRDAFVHSQLFDMEAQLRDMDRAGVGDYIEDIRRLPLDSSVKDGMLGHTAARLLKIAQ
jgi:hypothetical protein